MIKVIKVSGEKHFNSFIQLPRKMYRQDPFWTPVSDNSQRQIFNIQANPVLRHLDCELYLALDEQQQPVGRIAAITDDLLQDQKVGLFGCFETIHDIEVARALFKAATESLAARGKKEIQGPATINTNQQVGLLVEGFDSPPMFLMPYNPPYYGPLLEELGCSKKLDLYSYVWQPEHTESNTKLGAVARRAAKIPGIRLRPINLRDPWGEGGRVAEMHNRSMTNQWGFVPMNQEEGAAFLTGIRSFADPELLVFCEVDHKVIGVFIILPDLGPQLRAAKNSPGRRTGRPTSVRVGILAVVPEYRRRGVVALFIDHAIRVMTRKGYKHAELSLVMDSNFQMNSIITGGVGSEVNKVFRVYAKEIK